jgi:hypothetical protein
MMKKPSFMMFSESRWSQPRLAAGYAIAGQRQFARPAGFLDRLRRPRQVGGW